MNLFTYLKNLFNHHNYVINSNLVIPENIVKIPKRKDFHNNKLVNFYKEQYLTILSSMHDYDVLVLEANNLNETIEMTNKLLFNIALKENIFKEKTIKDRLTYLINKEKLLLYQNDLINIQNEVTARLISLNEIRKDLFLNKRKKETLDNVINRLCISLHILVSEQVSVISSINRYQNEAFYNYEANNIEEEYQVLDKIECHLKWLQQILPLDKQIIVNHDIKYIINDLALIEKNLEEYTYQNKNKITKESKEIELSKILEIPFDINHKEEILKEIEKLEIKYRAFYEYRESLEYGEIVIDESDLTNLYNLKFSALTISVLGIVNIFVNNNTDELELSYYENIVFSLIQDIILGKNEVFNKLFYQELDTALRLFKNINFYKGIYTDKDTLQDKHRLNFLLALNTEDGLYNFFTNTKMPDPIVYNKILFFDDLPLATICFIENADNDKKDNFYSIDNNCYYLYLLYRKYYKPEEDNAYHLPEGIIYIRQKSNNETNIKKIELNLINKIKKEAYGKKIYMPKSLKKIVQTTAIFEPNSIKELVLNEGLETICSKAFYDQQGITEINLPASIKRIEKDAFYSNITNITIHISKNNYALLNFDNLYALLDNTENTNLKDYLSPTALGLEEYESKTCKVKSKIQTLNIHLDDIDKDITLDLTNLEFEIEFDNQDYPTLYINELTNYINQSLEKLKNEFNELQQVLDIEERITIRDETNNLLTDLEIINNKLKEYVNTHVDEFLNIKELIYNYNNTCFYKEYLTEVISLESKYKLYYYYGLFTKHEIDMFYIAKYDYLTKKDIVNAFIDIPEEEFKIYQEIAERKFNMRKALRRTNSLVGGNNDWVDKITNLFKKELEDKSITEILKNFYLLNIFLAFTDKESKLYTFLSKFKIRYSYPYNTRFKRIFNIEENIPLSSICILKYYMNDTKDFEINLYNNEKYTITKNFLELFHLIYTHYALTIPEIKLSPELLDSYEFKPYNYYLIPEGITEINKFYTIYCDNIYVDPDKDEVELLENIRKDAEGKIVIVPNSIQILYGNIFGNIKIKGLILNEKITKISSNIDILKNEESSILLNQELKILSVPSNLKLPKLDINYIKNLVFNNMELENLERYKYFIKDLVTKTKDEQDNIIIKLKVENFIFHYDNLEEDIIIKSPIKTIDKNKSITVNIERDFFDDYVISYLKEELFNKTSISKARKK